MLQCKKKSEEENIALKSNYLPTVREQYENYPYPDRNPDDEKKRLLGTVLDPLSKINHYCFKGKRDLYSSFRALVAGGGTGDSTVFLAEQLRDTDTQIVHLDISSASIEVAKKRASVRGLKNIQWIEGSLMDLPQMDIGKFDYINCSGVLHHLESPIEGLNALKSVLDPDGAIGIMVYGKYGRTGVYQMQELMRLINENESDMRVQLDSTKAVLDTLPQTNWFKHSEHLFSHVKNKNDIEIFDVFLHSKDRPYTVLDIYEWINGCSLNFIDFVENQALYEPRTFIRNPALLQKINKMPAKKQQAIAEIIVGTLKKHTFYVSFNTDTVASLQDPDIIPFFHFCENVTAKQLYDLAIDKKQGETVSVKHPRKGIATFTIGKYTKPLLKHLNGYNPLNKIFELVKKEKEFKNGPLPDNKEIFEDFRNIYFLFNLMDLMVLRHRSVPPDKTYPEMQEPITRKYKNG
ncbi:MAG: class I SAM-dependent methyltransferase [Phycisphaerae bacterium]|nr:class I SAM-dependent methyltransferase [Phycisphaerae bacterium]